MRNFDATVIASVPKFEATAPKHWRRKFALLVKNVAHGAISEEN